MAIYEKPVWGLFLDFLKERNLKKDEILTRQEIVAWFEKKYPKIKKGTINAHLILFSINAPSRIHYGVSSTGREDSLFQINSSEYRLYDKDRDPKPIYLPNVDEEIDMDEEDNLEIAKEFAYERDLKNFLAKNLQVIEPGLRLYQDEDNITGVEYPVGGRFIDILGVDKDNNLVVIELKVSRGYDRVIGQLLRYMAWIEQNLADNGQVVRGVIIANKITEDLALASSKIVGVDLFEYELSLTLRKVTKN